MINDQSQPVRFDGEAIRFRLRALLVHLYTASTSFLLALSAYYLLQKRLDIALFTLLLTNIIDGTDGMLARRWRVKDLVPEYDGRRMDDVIDYVAYVFLPVVFLLQADMLVSPVIFASLPLIASAFGFARVDVKLDEDGFFVGFPSYWNIVVAYLYILATPAWFNSLLIALFAVLVFVPTRYIYITRFKQGRWLHFTGATVAGIALLLAVASRGEMRSVLGLISLIYPVIYMVQSLRAN